MFSVFNLYGNVYSDTRAIKKKVVETALNGGYILVPTTQQQMWYKAYLSVLCQRNGSCLREHEDIDWRLPYMSSFFCLALHPSIRLLQNTGGMTWARNVFVKLESSLIHLTYILSIMQLRTRFMSLDV